jgi:hypothetical protein
MLAKCTNPSCSKPFRYLHEGKLFRLEAGQPNGRSSYQRREWFWLCDECTSKVTLRVEVGEVVAMPLPLTTLAGADISSGVKEQRWRQG